MTGEGATVGKKVTDEAAEGTSRTFHLDPDTEDYGEVFDRITGAWTAEDSTSSPPAAPSRNLASTTKERSSKNTDQTTVSAAGVGGVVTGTGEQSEKITTDAEGYDVAVAGSGGAKGAGVVGGTELLSRENSGGMTGHLNSDTGIRTVFEETDAGRDLTGGDLGAIADVLTTGPGKALQAALTTQWTHLSGYALNEEHTRKLFARAGNPSHWATAGSSPTPQRGLDGPAHPAGAPEARSEFAEVDADAARDLTRLRALSSMKVSGTTGKNCITNVLGQGHWCDGASDAEDLGGFYERPPSPSTSRCWTTAPRCRGCSSPPAACRRSMGSCLRTWRGSWPGCSMASPPSNRDLQGRHSTPSGPRWRCSTTCRSGRTTWRPPRRRGS